MNIFLLFIKNNIIHLEGVYSTEENAINEVETGEMFCVIKTELDRCGPWLFSFRKK